jgi:hypothetical protein
VRRSAGWESWCVSLCAVCLVSGSDTAQRTPRPGCENGTTQETISSLIWRGLPLVGPRGAWVSRGVAHSAASDRVALRVAMLGPGPRPKLARAGKTEDGLLPRLRPLGSHCREIIDLRRPTLRRSHMPSPTPTPSSTPVEAR